MGLAQFDLLEKATDEKIQYKRSNVRIKSG